MADRTVHCPHYPEITGECECRKPKPGMILEAINAFDIDPKNSVTIGNNERDLEAGKRAQIGKNLYIQDLIKQGRF